MIVVMKAHCDDKDIDNVLTFLENHSSSGHPSRGVERTIIGVLGAVGSSGTAGSIGGINPTIGESLEWLPPLASVMRVSKLYTLAGRASHPDDTGVSSLVTCVSYG